jgi:hypothetical protein
MNPAYASVYNEESRKEGYMKHTAASLLFLLSVSARAAVNPPQPPAAPPPGRPFNHVVLIVLENEDNEAVLKNPIMGGLAKRGRYFSHYSGLFHPSYPNYLALIGGDFFHTRGDHQKTIRARTIADLLEEHHLTWTQYAEDYPGHCFLGEHSADRAKLYRRKHVPFLSFQSIQTSPSRCANVVPASQLDWHHLPNYAFYTPNMRNDGHDTGLDFAANWLKGFLAPVLDDHEVMKDTLIVVTFDESQTQSSNHIYTVFLGDRVQPGTDPKKHDHYSLLRTIEDNFGLGTLGAKDAVAEPIAFTPAPAPPQSH